MLITIITVNLNNREGLKKTLASVQAQTLKDKEHIIIDGGSEEGSVELIREHENQLGYWKSEEDEGIYAAMNRGVEASKGKYLLFLNSGDTFNDKDSLAHFVPFIEKERFDLIYGNIKVIGKKERIKTYPKKLDYHYFLKDTLPHPATLIHKRCFDEIKYDENLSIVSDWKFFMLGVLKHKFKYVYIDKLISDFYEDGISSTNKELVNKEKERVLKREFPFKISFQKFKNQLKSKVIKI